MLRFMKPAPVAALPAGSRGQRHDHVRRHGRGPGADGGRRASTTRARCSSSPPCRPWPMPACWPAPRSMSATPRPRMASPWPRATGTTGSAACRPIAGSARRTSPTTSDAGGYYLHVTVPASTIKTTFLSLVTNSISVVVSATAKDPIVTATINLNGWTSDAGDGNSIYWYKVPQDDSIPTFNSTQHQQRHLQPDLQQRRDDARDAQSPRSRRRNRLALPSSTRRRPIRPAGIIVTSMAAAPARPTSSIRSSSTPMAPAPATCRRAPTATAIRAVRATTAGR